MNYFDHAASSALYPEVLEVLFKAHKDHFSNPGSMHALGYALHESIEECRLGFLNALGAKSLDQFIFTSSATESNNTVISGLDFSNGDALLYSKADHPSVTAPIENLKFYLNLEAKEMKLLQDGSIDLEHFESLLDQNIKLVVLTHVNNQSGVINPINKLARMIKERTSAHVHIDAVQSFGKFIFKVTPDMDSMSVTSHKIGGPKGVAGLFLKHDHKVRPLLFGGGQENGFRASTQAYPLIVAFFKAMKISNFDLDTKLQKVQLMNDKIKKNLKENISSLEFPFEHSSPYIIPMLLPLISSDIILRHLEVREVLISSTSACSSKVKGFNPSLAALNIPEKYHKNFLRISLSSINTDKEVDCLIEKFIEVWCSVKHMLLKERG